MIVVRGVVIVTESFFLVPGQCGRFRRGKVGGQGVGAGGIAGDLRSWIGMTRMRLMCNDLLFLTGHLDTHRAVDVI